MTEHSVTVDLTWNSIDRLERRVSDFERAVGALNREVVRLRAIIDGQLVDRRAYFSPGAAPDPLARHMSLEPVLPPGNDQAEADYLYALQSRPLPSGAEFSVEGGEDALVALGYDFCHDFDEAEAWMTDVRAATGEFLRGSLSSH